MTTAKQVDALLPQTQCELCGFKGCMPYAEALVKKEAAINLCPPGGVEGLFKIAELLNEDPTPFIEDMAQKSKPMSYAVIREAECIGCTKCIPACPVDAILGAAKQMHTVIRDECTGCELCIAPCPVDCIDMVIVNDYKLENEKRSHFRKRHLDKKARLQRDSQLKLNPIHSNKILTDRKLYIQEAVLRAKAKKM